MNPQTKRQLHEEASPSDPNKLDLRNEIQKTYRSRPTPWFQWVFDHLDLPKQADILELGCGTGSLWQENRTKISPGWNIHMSDQSRKMILGTRENLAGLPSPVNFACLDGQKIPFPEDCFDVVLAIGVLDLMPDPDQALSEAWRVLRQSGQLVVSAGSHEHLLEMRRLLRTYLPGDQAERLGGESSRFGLENGKERLEAHFEEVIGHEYQDQMQFTGLQPVLDYVLSEDALVWDMHLDDLGRFAGDIKQHITDHGRLLVRISKGIFLARKKIV